MTNFTIIMQSQVRENYAFDEDGYSNTENPYWKFKGGHESVIAENLSANDIVNMGTSKIVDMCKAHEDYNTRNGVYELDYCDYEIVALDQSIIEKVKVVIEDENDYYCRVDEQNRVSDIAVKYAADVSEYEAKWAIGQLGYAVSNY